jgi:hypothetical protein
MSHEDRKRPKAATMDNGPKGHLELRLEPELVAEIDAVARELSTDTYRATRSDAIRMLVIKGIEIYNQRKWS